MNKKDKILLLGSNGMIGSSIFKNLKLNAFENILAPCRDELNLTNQRDVYKYFKNNSPSYVINAAARVGGIMDNVNNPVEMLTINLSIQLNLAIAAYPFIPVLLANLSF